MDDEISMRRAHRDLALRTQPTHALWTLLGHTEPTSPGRIAISHAVVYELGRRRPDVKALFDAVAAGENCTIPGAVFDDIRACDRPGCCRSTVVVPSVTPGA